MSLVKRSLIRTAHGIELAVDWARYKLRARRPRGPFHIEPYRGHGTSEKFYISGRVLEGERIPPAREEDSKWRNLRHTLRRIESDEVPGAIVRATFGEHSHEVTADEEGFFDLTLEMDTPLDAGRFWHSVRLELLEPQQPDGGVAQANCEVLVPPPNIEFGIISDIDDTVVRTDVTNLLRMLRLVLLTNARTRLPFEGVAAFYRALQAGAAGLHTNPIFYVSSSPWNFYDLLTEVFEVHGIPSGPLFLKDYGLARDLLLSAGHREHKMDSIRGILDTHPGVPFVLLGDSGQEDPEIYRDVVRSHPGRIKAIYIRDVGERDRAREIGQIAAEMREEGVELCLVPDTVSAARHAAGLGLISADALVAIEGDRTRDRDAPTPFESVVNP